jgi:hypothetical protein
MTAGVAVVAASSVVVGVTVAPPPPSSPAPPISATSAAVELTAVVASTSSTPAPDNIPTLFDEIRRGIIPSFGAAPPTPPPALTVAATSNANQAIKNIYNAVEPWVRYGFEVATYAVGWIPYVGWLSGQIMIFYNFGERIVRSITFNVADWLFGPLPFIQGLGNVARDSWNALVQLGVDQWNFWLPPLPPLPPLPFAARPATAAPTVPLAASAQQSGLPAATAALKSTETDIPVVSTDRSAVGLKRLLALRNTAVSSGVTAADVPQATSTAAVPAIPGVPAKGLDVTAPAPQTARLPGKSMPVTQRPITTRPALGPARHAKVKNHQN